MLSIIEHLAHAYSPYDTTIALDPQGRLETMPVRGGTVIQAAPGLVIYRFGAGLYYANATRFTEEALAILDEADPKIEWFCLSGASMGDIDYSGAGAIRQVASEVKEHGATFVICELEPGVGDLPKRYGLEAEIGGVYPFIEDVIVAFDQRAARPRVDRPPRAGAPPAREPNRSGCGTIGRDAERPAALRSWPRRSSAGWCGTCGASPASSTGASSCRSPRASSSRSRSRPCSSRCSRSR